jgi:hypothetical protein
MDPVSIVSVLCNAIKVADKLIELRKCWRDAPATLDFVFDKSSLVRNHLDRLSSLLEGETPSMHFSHEQHQHFLNVARGCETVLNELDREVSERPGVLQARDKEDRLKELTRRLDSYVVSMNSALILQST